MLSLTSEYALRALIHLAQHEGDGPIPGRRIAETADIPPKYLAKVLGDLVRCGVLDSAPGKSGGFALHRPARLITLLDVLAPFEQFERRRCPFGNKQCSDIEPCLAHAKWKQVVDAERDFLGKTTLREVAVREGKQQKRKRKPVPRRT